MAPWIFTPAVEAVATVLIGFCFGFVLERAGFGNSLNLAAQFYLHNMRVLKVMFTAIVTAALLVFLTSALGWLEFERVAVPATYLGPAIVGGLLLGVGFIVGGYCPGTSLVAAATLKLDGMAFAAGVLAGLLAFAETSPLYWDFFNSAGYSGRLTLPDALGVDAGLVVLGVVVMAVGAFAFAEVMERKFARGEAPKDIRASHVAQVERPFQAVRSRPESPSYVWRRAAIGAALGVAAVSWLVGQPSLERKMAWADRALSASLSERTVHIDPGELLALMQGNLMPVVLLDTRDEADFNVFHLLDARRVELAELTPRLLSTFPAKAVVVVMSNDEAAAQQAWKRLAVLLNPNPYVPVTDRSRVYVLAGGINRWIDLYRDGHIDVPGPDAPAAADDRFAHAFSAALGDRHAFSRPSLKSAPARSFTAKVKAAAAKRAAGSGCG